MAAFIHKADAVGCAEDPPQHWQPLHIPDHMLLGDVAVKQVPHHGLQCFGGGVLLVLKVERLPDAVLHSAKYVLNGTVDVMTVGWNFQPASVRVKLNGLLFVPGVVGVIEGGDVGGGLNFCIVIRQPERISGLGPPSLDNVEQVVFKLFTCRGLCFFCGTPCFLQVTNSMAGQGGPALTSHAKISRIVGAAQPGVWVDMYGSSGPELCFSDSSRLRITSSLGVHRLILKCEGCDSDRRHFKVATCKSVKKLSDLWCALCMYSEEQWEGAGKRKLPGCELWFMGVLWMLGLDTQFAFQATTPFWDKPLDAYHLQLGYYVQIDGRCHWVGMMGQSRDQVLQRDMEQNKAAAAAGAVLVRIHTSDTDTEGVVEAALQAAADGYSIVLTPSYGVELYTLHGWEMLYKDALWWSVGNCYYVIDRYGNYCFRRV